MKTILLILFSLHTISGTAQHLEVDGHIDVKGNKIANVADPLDPHDAATRAYVDKLQAEIQLLKELAGIGSVTDVDGNIYSTIKIGTQVWMRENLRTSRYANDDLIPNIIDSASWANANTGAFCWYDNDSTPFETPYGKLYNWYTVNDERGVCPDQWHVPTDLEWNTLRDLLDPAGSGPTDNVAGSKMKETGILHWNTPNSNATNESGFTGLGAGHRDHFANFVVLGIGGTFWSSTEFGSLGADFYSLNNTAAYLFYSNHFKKVGFSVRCIKN